MTPTVSIVTLTKDRRRFIPQLIRTVDAQTFPKDRIEWIIADDGPDPIEDLVRDVPYARYFYSEHEVRGGKKWNYANSLAKGDYIFYFDDDDYSFPHRVEAGVAALESNRDQMIVGSSEMHIYSTSAKTVFVCGPYQKNHATSGTWGFRRTLLQTSRFDDVQRGIEASFTRDWTVPLMQVGRDDIIVAIDHGNNTSPKDHLLRRAKEFFPLEEIINSKQACAFYASL